MSNHRPILSEGLHVCPAHDDRGPSLHVTRAADGRWLLHCFAGCTVDAIIRAAGLTWREVFGDLPLPARGRPVRPPRSEEHRARLVVLQRAERARARRREWLLEWWAADQIRLMEHRIATARRWATRLGPDSEGAWALLAYAARLEGTAHQLEAALDGE